jgi:hypothetical protein
LPVSLALRLALVQQLLALRLALVLMQQLLALVLVPACAS